MVFFSELARHLAVLGELCGEDVSADELPGIVRGLSPEDAIAVIAEATALVHGAETLRIAASGVVAAGSTREHGHAGVAQTRGHRSPVSLVQELMGTTRADAAKHVRLGEALLSGSSPPAPSNDAHAAEVPEGGPWHAGLSRALLAGAITSAQHDVILRGLGEPPTAGSGEASAAAVEAWSIAGDQLIAEAAERTVEELARTARTVRDALDPEGAAERFDERFARRSWRSWTDQDGMMHASLVFDDHGGAWVHSIIDAALRPRRGGPRFVDPGEKARAQELIDDPRTNEQLAYDLLIDVLRTGALADPSAVFGTKQAGVRVVVTDSAAGLGTGGAARPGVAIAEDGQGVLPAWAVEQRICDSGTLVTTIDPDGNPLYLGREQRLFSPKQRIALAVRDGGCRWRGCDRPASYCEAHHIDEYAAGGRTDIDRGILLCRFHHMQLHHGGWRITRAGIGDFLVHPPGGGAPIVLKPRLALAYARSGIDPPPKRFRPSAAPENAPAARPRPV